MTMRQVECEFCGQTFDSAEQLMTHEEELQSDEVAARDLDEYWRLMRRRTTIAQRPLVS